MANKEHSRVRDECRKMSDTELLQTIREHPMFPLFPAVQELVDRVKIQPERHPCKICGGKQPEVRSCKACDGEGVDLT